MKRKLAIFSTIIITIVLATSIAIVTNAASTPWWQEAYQWARQNQIVGDMSQKDLESYVTSDRFYDIMGAYINKTKLAIYENPYYKIDITKGIMGDNSIAGILNEINSIQEENASGEAPEGMTTKVPGEMTTEDTTTTNTQISLDLYRRKASKLDYLAQYVQSYNKEYLDIAIINSVLNYVDASKFELANSIVENADTYEAKYAIIDSLKRPTSVISNATLPLYMGEITREDFLNVMYQLHAKFPFLNTEEIMGKYIQSKVLQGDGEKEMYAKRLTYAEFLTFLYRFQNFNFEYVVIDAAMASDGTITGFQYFRTDTDGTITPTVGSDYFNAYLDSFTGAFSSVVTDYNNAIAEMAAQKAIIEKLQGAENQKPEDAQALYEAQTAYSQASTVKNELSQVLKEEIAKVNK